MKKKSLIKLPLHNHTLLCLALSHQKHTEYAVHNNVEKFKGYAFCNNVTNSILEELVVFYKHKKHAP